jgi:hypothetical protein
MGHYLTHAVADRRMQIEVLRRRPQSAHVVAEIASLEAEIAFFEAPFGTKPWPPAQRMPPRE